MYGHKFYIQPERNGEEELLTGLFNMRVSIFDDTNYHRHIHTRPLMTSVEPLLDNSYEYILNCIATEETFKKQDWKYCCGRLMIMLERDEEMDNLYDYNTVYVGHNISLCIMFRLGG